MKKEEMYIKFEEISAKEYKGEINAREMEEQIKQIADEYLEQNENCVRVKRKS